MPGAFGHQLARETHNALAGRANGAGDRLPAPKRVHGPLGDKSPGVRHRRTIYDREGGRFALRATIVTVDRTPEGGYAAPNGATEGETAQPSRKFQSLAVLKSQLQTVEKQLAVQL